MTEFIKKETHLDCNKCKLFQHSHNKCCLSKKHFPCIDRQPDNRSSESFNHNIQLQLHDVYGVPVPDTEFWVTLSVVKEGNKVTIQLPLINFQTGPFADSPYEPPNNNPFGIPGTYPPFEGGYLYTSDGYLPKHVRPNDIENRSWLAASNNGASLPFTFPQSQVPSTLPVPVAGYILQVTNAGGIVVQAAGTFGNVIPPGPQILLPTTITYIAKSIDKLKANTDISHGSTSTAGFTNSSAADAGLRDSHVNDAFEGIAAWTWTDNSMFADEGSSMITDKTNGTLNVMVAIGKIKRDGTLKVRKPVQLTDFPPETLGWDTAVAINRTNRKNIVVSYGVIDEIAGTSLSCRAVSFDGGKTWPDRFDGTTPVTNNGPTNIQPTGASPGGFGDNRGVSFRSIW